MTIKEGLFTLYNKPSRTAIFPRDQLFTAFLKEIYKFAKILSKLENLNSPSAYKYVIIG